MDSSQSQVKEGSVTYVCEDENRLMVREGCNKVGRFLEVAVEADGGRKGTIWLLEGRKGWGWRRFVGEMKRMLEYQGGKFRFATFEFPPLSGKQVEGEVFASSGDVGRLTRASLGSPESHSGNPSHTLGTSSESGTQDQLPNVLTIEYDRRDLYPGTRSLTNLRTPEPHSANQCNGRQSQMGTRSCRGRLKY